MSKLLEIKNIIRKFLFIAIVFFQILTIIYWGIQKNNLYIDDLYSISYAQSFTGQGDTAQYITTSQDFSFYKWINNSSLKKHLILSDKEKYYNLSALGFLERLINGRNYFGLLNMSESILGISSISVWPGIILNILFLIISDIFLLLLLAKLEIDTKLRYLSLIMFGFSSYIISTMCYTRFYMLVITLQLIVLNLIYKVWNAIKYSSIIAYELAILITVYFSYKNSELTLIYFFGIEASIILLSIITKRWKQLIVNISVCIIGVIYIFISTNYIEIVTHPELYANSTSVAVRASNSITNFTVISLIRFLCGTGTILATMYFAGYIMIITYVIIGTIALLSLAKNRHEVILKKESKIKLSSNDSYIILVLISVVIYTLLCAMCAFHGIWRYYFYGFVSTAIIIWYLVDRILKSNSIKKAKNKYIVILTVFVVINVIMPFFKRNIDFIYENEKEFVCKIKENQNLDVVLCVYVNDINNKKTISRHETYDCVYHMSEQSKVYCINLSQYEDEDIDYPNRFLLWSHCDSEYADLTDVIKDLKTNNYKVELLGTDHCSKVYLCELK